MLRSRRSIAAFTSLGTLITPRPQDIRANLRVSHRGDCTPDCFPCRQGSAPECDHHSARANCGCAVIAAGLEQSVRHLIRKVVDARQNQGEIEHPVRSRQIPHGALSVGVRYGIA